MKFVDFKRTIPKSKLEESSKNTHLEHLEDLIFDHGYEGGIEALNYVESVRKMLMNGSGTSNKLSVKWDGSPAIVCGHDPEDRRFFVGTKSVFNKKAPKLCKSDTDINKFYADKPELAEKLRLALKYLPSLGIGGVVQGDLLFTSSDIVEEKINGEDCYSFTPNTITYAVPKNSEIGQRIHQAKLGIIFHTTYTGHSIASMTAHHGTNVSGFHKNKNVWFDDASYKDFTGVASFTPVENKKILDFMNVTHQAMIKIGSKHFDIILHNKEFADNIKPFINKSIRQGTHVGDPERFLQQFLVHYTEKLVTEIESLKGGIESHAAKARIKKIQAKEKWIDENSDNLLAIMAIYKSIIELKHLLLNKLARIEGIGTFQKTENGYKVTAPEGFVAIGHTGGAVKLVDRLEYSRANFLNR